MLRSAAGTYVPVQAVRAYTATHPVYNLTIATTHTYYVGGGPTSALTHNTSCGKAAKAANGGSKIKAGSEGGASAGKAFSQKVRQDVLDENPSTCVYCRMETDRPQVDHAIPRSRGGNATFENGQTTCWWCNASKGARGFPVNPPPGYEGMWPPEWWGVFP